MRPTITKKQNRYIDLLTYYLFKKHVPFHEFTGSKTPMYCGNIRDYEYVGNKISKKLNGVFIIHSYINENESFIKMNDNIFRIKNTDIKLTGENILKQIPNNKNIIVFTSLGLFNYNIKVY